MHSIQKVISFISKTIIDIKIHTVCTDVLSKINKNAENDWNYIHK